MKKKESVKKSSLPSPNKGGNTKSTKSEDVTADVAPASQSAEETQKTTSEQRCYEAFKFSYSFFSDGIKNLFKNILPEQGEYKGMIDNLNIADKIKAFSKIFKDITTIPVHENCVNNYVTEIHSLTVFNGEWNIGSLIEKIIDSHYRDNSCKCDSKYLLYIQGPIGCYKNRLLQYIYLSEVTKLQVPIFYIDFSKYEKNRKTIEEDIKKIKTILANYNDRPLFILDNIRGFLCGSSVTEAYDEYKKLLDLIKCRIISCRDVEFNRFGNRNYDLPFGKNGETKDICEERNNGTVYKTKKYEEGNYQNEISISSMNLSREKESQEFIGNCTEFFYDDIGEGVLANFYNRIDKKLNIAHLRDYLISLNLVTIDAYQFVKIVLKGLSGIENIDECSLTEICSKFIVNNGVYGELLTKIQENAYLFEYDNRDSTIDFDILADIRQHKSILDFVIANNYITELKTKLGNSNYDLPNVLFPKNINRFIDPVFKNNAVIKKYVEESFNNIAKDNIVGNFGKLSQLVFLLGRNIGENSDEYNTQIINTLKSCLKIAEESRDGNAKNNLLRSIYISLIYKGDQKSFKEYCGLLLNDSEFLHKNINIGFHLDYYGDSGKQSRAFKKDEVPRYDNKVPSKYLNTLRTLLLELKLKLQDNCDKTTFMKATLQLISLCQIIEKLEYGLDETAEQEGLIGKFFVYLLRVLYEFKSHSDCLSDRVKQYLKKVLKKINKKYYNNKLNFNPNIDRIKLYNRYSKLYTTGRQGWLIRGMNGYDATKKIDGEEYKGIRNSNIAESVAEHVLNCWLLGYIFLPDASEKNEKTYNKQKILNLLSVHDYAEAEIGDSITESLSEENKKKRKEKEKNTIKKLIGQDDILFKEWCETWYQKIDDKSNVNSKIAYDIDHLQPVYQYFCYYIDKTKTNPIKKDEKTVMEWLNELSKLKSDIVKEIACDIIFKNNAIMRNLDFECVYWIYKFFTKGKGKEYKELMEKEKP